MKVAQFDFDLPARFIARRPVRPRDAARLLMVAEDAFDDAHVRDLPQLLGPGDLLVCNDTRVLPARLMGVRAAARGTAKLEVTLMKAVTETRWTALARPARRLAVGDEIRFEAGLGARVTARGEGGEVTLDFGPAGAGLPEVLERAGAMPLPPYLGRDADDADRADYQTVFAARPGAVAAPTAGLHFTRALLKRLDGAGIGLAKVTLHVGAGTFLPVKAEDTRDHVMHPEWGEVSADAARSIGAARAAGGRIVAVGTTSLRLLEAAADAKGKVHPFTGETDLFMTPGYKVRAADLLLTNFHLPRSSLFMLVCAVAGTGRMKAAYEYAKASGYRFYSYGDCCLLSLR